MIALILAGGKGTRLKSLVSDVPKPLAPISGKPFLEYLINYLINFNVEKIYISVGYKKEKIINYFIDTEFSKNIEYVEENEPLGTGGAIKLFLEKEKILNTSKEIIILNGDTFFPINISSFISFHKENRSDFTIAAKQISNNDRYSSISSKENKIINFAEPNQKTALINGGVYIINPKKIASNMKKNNFKNSFSLENDFFKKTIDDINYHVMEFSNPFIDIGIPEDYLRSSDIIMDYIFKNN
jgi:D-glycero-alpha-D-manno-heptose 1-phosphate guanylyltransferase